MMKLKGLQEAVEDINGSRNCWCHVMYHPGDDEVWVDHFAGANDHKRYHDKSIFRVAEICPGEMDGYKKVTIERLMEEIGWSIEARKH
jgi:hypothetical protein